MATATAEPIRSPAFDPADPAARGVPPVSKPGAETQAERDAVTRAAAKDDKDEPKLTPEQAKTLLLDAARAFDPMRSLREHPFIVVGAAAGAGVVVGSSGHTVVHLSKLAASLSKLAKPLAGVLGQFAVAQFAGKHAADTAREEANAASAANI